MAKPAIFRKAELSQYGNFNAVKGYIRIEIGNAGGSHHLGCRIAITVGLRVVVPGSALRGVQKLDPRGEHIRYLVFCEYPDVKADERARLRKLLKLGRT